MSGCQSSGSGAEPIRQTNLIKPREGLGDGLGHFYLFFFFFFDISKADYFLKVLLGRTQLVVTLGRT